MLFGLTKKDRGRTGKVVRQVERGGVPGRRNKRPMQSKAAGRVRRAQTSAAWSAGTTTTAFLLDSDGNELTDNEITVNFFESYSANNFPVVGDDKIIPVFKDVDGSWYCLLTIIVTTPIDNVLVEFNIDTGAKKFQTKKRDDVKVLSAGSVSGYVDEHTGTECT